MYHKQPFWRKPLAKLLLIVLAVSAGAWLALDRPVPQSWQDADGRPDIRLPAWGGKARDERMFCAESADTGGCRCILADGTRPQVSQEECRRRARTSASD